MMASVRLHPGKDKPVRQRHPWVFSGAIARLDGEAGPGDVVDVVDGDGGWLARGAYNPRSQIAVRLLTWEQSEAIDADFWRRRLAAASAARAALDASTGTTACRLVHAESDGVPGLIVDRYGDWLCVQFLTAGAEAHRDELLAVLQALHGPAGIVERSDVHARRQEGLPLRSGIVAGIEPPRDLEIAENGLRFRVDLLGGQKTGFYLDQRENRRIVGSLARGRRVLNAFSYTGAFGVYALAGGAQHVTNLDSSLAALEEGEENLRVNGFDPDRQAEGICGDAFEVLRSLRRDGRRFDMVILDPPKFARSRAELVGATRGYKDINLQGMALLDDSGEPTGEAPLLATFSCSGLVSIDLFQKVVFGASADAGRSMQIIARLCQGADHPVLLSFPEGEYLKGLVLRAV